MGSTRDLYNKHKHLIQQKYSLELKQFLVEEHLKEHRADYISVVANEKLKSEVLRLDYKIKQNIKMMEISSDVG